MRCSLNTTIGQMITCDLLEVSLCLSINPDTLITSIMEPTVPTWILSVQRLRVHGGSSSEQFQLLQRYFQKTY